MSSSTPKPDADTPPAVAMISEVRYSLPEMLEEIEAERATAAFAMEILDQNEIGKIFKAKSQRRGKPAK